MDDETRLEIARLRQELKDLREYVYRFRDENFERYLRAKDLTYGVSARVAYIEGYTGLERNPHPALSRSTGRGKKSHGPGAHVT